MLSSLNQENDFKPMVFCLSWPQSCTETDLESV